MSPANLRIRRIQAADSPISGLLYDNLDFAVVTGSARTATLLVLETLPPLPSV